LEKKRSREKKNGQKGKKAETPPKKFHLTTLSDGVVGGKGNTASRKGSRAKSPKNSAITGDTR